jgi:hypothetical protein
VTFVKGKVTLTRLYHFQLAPLEQIVRKLREADRLQAEGADFHSVCRHVEISVRTYSVERVLAEVPWHAWKTSVYSRLSFTPCVRRARFRGAQPYSAEPAREGFELGKVRVQIRWSLCESQYRHAAV